MTWMFAVANTKKFPKARRMPRKIQKQRKETVARTKTIAQGIMTIRTIMNTSPIIDFIQMTVKRMIVNPNAMNAFVT